MASNQLSGPIPSSWGNFSKLTLLGIWGNKFTGSIPPELGQLVNLQSLELFANQLSGQIPSSLGNLTSLTILHLYGNLLSGPIPSSLRNLVNLEQIWLQDNQGLDGTLTPVCVTTSGVIPHVWITGTNVTIGKCLSSCTSSSPQCCLVISSWRQMGGTTSVSSTSATACCNYVVSSTGTTTTQNSGIPGVRCTSTGIVTEINWWGQGLVNSIPAELFSLTNLTVLSLGDNWLGGSIPPAIGNLVNLQHIHFYYNSLTGYIPPELGKLVNLQGLALAGNQLTGPIPSSLGNLTNLVYLPLWGNQLTGSIPPELGNLVSLQQLQLFANKLTGSIPAELGNLVNLRELEIYGNLLSGPIPSSLSNLVKLETIWLQDNQGLNGTLTPQCQTPSGVIPHVWISGTNVTICGCAAASNPPGSFPHPETPAACLATGPALTLSKRILAFSQVIGSFKYTCNTDSYNNPYADCLNSMAKICNTTDSWTLEKKANCHTGVNMMFGNMSTHWQRVRKQCGQWSFSTYPADPSDNCVIANSNLRQQAYYLDEDIRVPVTLGLTESIKARLWSNARLKG